MRTTRTNMIARKPRLVLAAALFTWTGILTADVVPAITKYPVPTAGSGTLGITAGPDGALWFTEQTGNKIGRITTAGAITEYLIPTAGSRPTRIAAGPDGALWFTERSGNRIGRITTTGMITEYPIPTAFSNPQGITAGPDGALWFTEGGKIGRITTAGAITEYPIPTAVSGAYGITAGPDGALWFTESAGNKIGRITTTGAITEYPVQGPASPFGITAGPDGALWFGNFDDKIRRITTAGAVTEYSILPNGVVPSEITVGPDGALWFTPFNAIGRITTAGVISIYRVVDGSSMDPTGGIATGPDGAIWFTQQDKIGRLALDSIPGATPLRFVPVPPCRVADTRLAPGPFGGPQLFGGTSRTFPVPQSACNIPSNAQAYSLNVTVVPAGPLSYLTAWPAGQPQPFVSTLNSFTGDIVANAAIVPAGTGGAISVYVTDRTDVVLDINGYFAPAGTSQFYPVTPCRVFDSRMFASPIPGIPGGTSRNFAIPQSACNIPATAQAYALNFTVVPMGPLSYLTAWPAGQPQPFVSTLNSFKGEVVANAAIVPAGTDGAISVYVTDRTDLVIDINGYFGPPGGAGAMNFYTATPCRVADTRSTAGPFGGQMNAASSRDFTIPQSACGIPAAAKAYSMNVTVVPPGPLSYLTAWPAGLPQPLVSTLNSFLGKVVANAAIIPAGTNGALSVYVTDRTDVVLDINGFFAP